jgi:TonB-linked SusC/RagA family outer membrane protein
MKKLKLLFPIIFLCLSVGLLAQEIQITGNVTDEQGASLPGVSIVVEGTTRGTVTDQDGNYSIKVQPDRALVFSFVGHSTRRIEVTDQIEIQVTLETDMANLDEVVVIGYGSVKKTDLTGSVSSLNEESLTQGVVSNVDQMIMGRAPGVQIYQNSSEPGGGINVQIRGVGSVNAGNEPLYVIDGLPIDNAPAVAAAGPSMPGNRNPRNPLNAINPSDIESIEILKDASATAIYGARGANGVIMITTKKGTEGKMQVNYDAYYGMQQVANKLDVMTATEYQTVLNELYDAGAVNAGVGERVEGIQDGGTDWQDEIFRDAPVQNHNLSFLGGDENTRYFSSFNYYNQQGTVINSGMKRYSARLNLDENFGNRLKFGVNINTSYIEDNYVPNGVVPNEAGGAVSAAYDFDPTLRIWDETTGRYNTSPFITKDNPLAIAYGKSALGKSWRTFGTAFGELFILQGLSVKLNVGADFNHTRKDVFTDDKTKDGLAANGIAAILNGNRYNYLIEGTVNYNRVFDDVHTFGAVAGVTTQKFFLERSTAESRDFVSLSTGTNSLQSGNPEQYQVSSSSVPSTLLSFLARANYSFADRYLITATIRADGSSKFGENNKFGYFPSFAVAWKLMNEDFISSTGIFHNLKLRASWGQTGNQEIGNFRSLTTFSQPGGNTPDFVIGDTRYTVNAPTRMANPDLKWETTTQTDIGLDWGLLKGRISGSVDYFNRLTTDLLLDLPVPAQTGFTTKLANVGSVRNSGLEFLLDSRNLIGEFQWYTSLNLTYLKNEVIDLGPIDQIIHGGVQFADNLAIITPGEALDSYYGWEILGVWQTNDDFGDAPAGVSAGDWKYLDLDGDGTITADDRQIMGSCIPDFTWGMTNTFSFKGFNLNIYLVGLHGMELMNNQLKDALYPINFRRNKLAEPYLNRWTPNNPTNEWASFINPSSQGSNIVNNRTVEDASYIRLQNVTLSYTVPVQNISLFRSLNIYVSGTNLITWTEYSGMDPGANVNGTNNAALRLDYNSYPFSRVYTIGVKAGF